jgi:hypothetical protein
MPHYCVVRFERVAFTGDFDTPADLDPPNSAYAVEDINGGAAPWLTPASWTKSDEPIRAGVTFDEFARLIRKAGGRVFVELPIPA